MPYHTVLLKKWKLIVQMLFFLIMLSLFELVVHSVLILEFALWIQWISFKLSVWAFILLVLEMILKYSNINWFNVKEGQKETVIVTFVMHFSLHFFIYSFTVTLWYIHIYIIFLFFFLFSRLETYSKRQCI